MKSQEFTKLSDIGLGVFGAWMGSGWRAPKTESVDFLSAVGLGAWLGEAPKTESVASLTVLGASPSHTP